MVGAGEREHTLSTIRAAIRDGRDMAEALDQAGLLHTERRERDTRASALAGLLATLENYGIVAILARNRRGSGATPQQTFNLIMDVIRERIEQEK